VPLTHARADWRNQSPEDLDGAAICDRLLDGRSTLHDYIEEVNCYLIRPSTIYKIGALFQFEATVKRHVCSLWGPTCNGPEGCFFLSGESTYAWLDGYVPFPCSPPSRVARTTQRKPHRIVRADVIPTKTRLFVFARDGHRCVNCGRGAPLEIDHIVPKHHGGSREIENLQSLCPPCNRAKGARLDWDGLAVGYASTRSLDTWEDTDDA
jgi:5-methylcytosine-specific restriction endonuclease McrA